MPKRKKHPKLPNGYGSIKYLGKNRRNPYAVHPPVTDYTDEGVPITPKALCYVDDWMKGFIILTSYKAGTYTKGDERDIDLPSDQKSLEIITQRLLADYNKAQGIVEEEKEPEKTFAEVYKDFWKYKFENEKGKKLSESSKLSIQAAFKNAKALHDRPFRDLRHDDLQSVIDNCPLKHSSLELIVHLFRQMYAYADIYELCDKDYSAHVKINKEDDDESGVPFTDSDLKILWDHKDDEIVEFILIMCYSGFRIKAYKTLEINMREKYFKGGVKTKAGKDRIVPIHSAILKLVENRLSSHGVLLSGTLQIFRNNMYKKLSELGIEKHTPHDCRHTFSMLCEKYGVNENDRKRLIGHSFGSDITNSLYGHRTVEDLRSEIEKIKVCY